MRGRTGSENMKRWESKSERRLKEGKTLCLYIGQAGRRKQGRLEVCKSTPSRARSSRRGGHRTLGL